MKVGRHIGAGLEKIEHSLNEIILLAMNRKNDSFPGAVPGAFDPLLNRVFVENKNLFGDVW